MNLTTKKILLKTNPAMSLVASVTIWMLISLSFVHLCEMYLIWGTDFTPIYGWETDTRAIFVLISMFAGIVFMVPAYYIISVFLLGFITRGELT